MVKEQVEDAKDTLFGYVPDGSTLSQLIVAVGALDIGLSAVNVMSEPVIMSILSLIGLVDLYILFALLYAVLALNEFRAIMKETCFPGNWKFSALIQAFVSAVLIDGAIWATAVTDDLFLARIAEFFKFNPEIAIFVWLVFAGVQLLEAVHQIRE